LPLAFPEIHYHGDLLRPGLPVQPRIQYPPKPGLDPISLHPAFMYPTPSMNKDLAWRRNENNPVLPTREGTWMESQTANPDLLLLGDTYHMYFRGQQGGHDRIGLATVPEHGFDGVTWEILSRPVIDVGAPGSWDETHALDPAAAAVDGTIYLYYSAVCERCDRSVCLATSRDGVQFEKFADNPVVIGGGPEVVYFNGLFHLLYWKERKGRRGFQIHLSTSRDGYRFEEASAEPVLAAGPEGAWDSHTVETPRIFREGGLFYMVYCGSDRNDDYPSEAGLATSRDLVQWNKYPGNPIFSRGNEGEWDEGAIWFTTVEKIDGVYYMWYEGYGGGTARKEPYGSYLKGGRSQIGLATMKADYFYVR